MSEAKFGSNLKIRSNIARIILKTFVTIHSVKVCENTTRKCEWKQALKDSLRLLVIWSKKLIQEIFFRLNL